MRGDESSSGFGSFKSAVSKGIKKIYSLAKGRRSPQKSEIRQPKKEPSAKPVPVDVAPKIRLSETRIHEKAYSDQPRGTYHVAMEQNNTRDLNGMTLITSTMSGKQKQVTAKFFGEIELQSPKAREVLGSITNDASAVKASDDNLRKEWRDHREQEISRVLKKKIELEQFKIPENSGKISDKFLDLCGDNTMRTMAKRFVPKNQVVSKKAMKFLGSTELVPEKAKKVVGKDDNEIFIDNQITEQLKKLNK